MTWPPPPRWEEQVSLAKTGRVLGIDLGIKRTGLAVSDELRLSVRALPNLVPKSRAEDIAALVLLVVELGVVDIAIGLPLMPQSGDDNQMSRRVRGFSQALQEALLAKDLACEVHFVDERYSSREATARLVDSGVPLHKRRHMIDSEAARGFVFAWIQKEPEQASDFAAQAPKR